MSSRSRWVVAVSNRTVLKRSRAVVKPVAPGRHRNDCTAYRDSGIKDQVGNRPVMTDGGYRGNPDVIMPYRKPAGGSPLPEWKEELNAVHRSISARVEHTLAHMKCWNILRDYRRAAHTLADAVSGIAHLHNITLAN